MIKGLPLSIKTILLQKSKQEVVMYLSNLSTQNVILAAMFLLADPDQPCVEIPYFKVKNEPIVTDELNTNLHILFVELSANLKDAIELYTKIDKEGVLYGQPFELVSEFHVIINLYRLVINIYEELTENRYKWVKYFNLNRNEVEIIE